LTHEMYGVTVATRGVVNSWHGGKVGIGV